MRAIQTKFHGPTNTRGARISANDGEGIRVTVPYYTSSQEDPHHRAAIALCRKMGWYGKLAHGGRPDGNVYVWVDDGYSTLDVTQEPCSGKPNNGGNAMGMHEAAINQAQERASREGERCMVYLGADSKPARWYVRSASEGTPPERAGLLYTAYPDGRSRCETF
jgi:hypothetical protein